MNKKVLIVLLCILGNVSDAAAFKPVLYFTSHKIVKNAAAGLNFANNKLKVKVLGLSVQKAQRGLGKASLATLIAAVPAKGVPTVVSTVSAVAEKAADTIAIPVTQLSSIAAPVLSQVSPVVSKVAHVVSEPLKQFTSSAPVVVVADVTKKAIITPLQKIVAAGSAAAVGGMGYIGSRFARFKPVPVPTFSQRVLNGILQHKIVVGGVCFTTLATAYCVHYKINPVKKIKNYFGSSVTA